MQQSYSWNCFFQSSCILIISCEDYITVHRLNMIENHPMTKCFTVFSSSILILCSSICLPRWLRGIYFPTLCLCPIKCGSLQIWVSGSFMHWSYSELTIQPCLSSLQHAAHSCLDVALKICQRTHTRQKCHLKNSSWQLRISHFLPFYELKISVHHPKQRISPQGICKLI